MKERTRIGRQPSAHAPKETAYKLKGKGVPEDQLGTASGTQDKPPLGSDD